MDFGKEAKTMRGQRIIIGAVIGACAGLLVGNLLVLVVIGGALGYVSSLVKPKQKK